MDLEELKLNWKSLDEKIMVSQKLNEKMIRSMLKDQSKSTVYKIRNRLRRLALFFAFIFILFIAILAGNPFDYTHWYEYFPAVSYTLLLVAGLEIVVREFFSVSKITLEQNNLRESLSRIIVLHASYKTVMERIWKISLVIGFLLGISLMVRNFEKYGLAKSLLFIVGNAVTVILAYLLAKKIFKKIPDRNLEELKTTLAELDE